jgi:acetolactate synthase-1/2/3 large subunit
LLRGSEILIKCILNENTRFISGIPGEQNLGILDALYDVQDDIQFILMKDERNAAFFADVHYRLTGEPGICLSTLGPGATNLVTGLANAYLDRSAVVAITGQLATKEIVKEAHQKISVSDIFAPVTKWSFSITNSDVIPEAVRKAFKIAKSEKPGPTHLELPSDIQNTQSREAKPLEILLYEPKYPPGANLEILSKGLDYLLSAEFPIVLIGNGSVRSDASTKILNLVEKWSLPVISTYMGKGVISEDHPLHLGILGAFSGDVAFNAIKRSDVVLAIGYDFTELHADYWNKDRKRLVVHLDSTAAEIDENYPVRYEIIGNINRTLHFLLRLKEMESRRKKENRLKEIKELKKEYVEKLYPKEKENLLTPSTIIRVINKIVDEETIISVDVGEHKVWMSRCLKSYSPRTYLVSNGLATMGFSLPATIAAKTIFPQKPVLCTIGDGGFAMTFGELETVKRLRLAFPIIVFNNDLLGLVYTKQKMSYGERKIGVALDNPDFVMIAKAFGMNGVRITKEEELGEALEEAFLSDKTSILDVSVDPNETIRISKLLGQTREMA